MERTFKAVYAGKREGDKHPIVHAWIVLNDDGSLGEALYFIPKKQRTGLTKALIGQIRTVNESSTGGFNTANQARIGMYDGPELSEWRLASDTAETNQSTAKVAKTIDYNTMTIEGARDSLRKTIGRCNRAAKIAVLIQYITS